jgi:gluconate 2-dehydrogenase alpha chain
MTPPEPASPLLALNPYEARTAAAIFERIFPADDSGPGAAALGVLAYVDRALAGAYAGQSDGYRLGLAALDRCAHRSCGRPFADCAPEQQDMLLAELERGALPDFLAPPQAAFFALLRAHTQEGLFADPAYGGNRDKGGWRWLGHPGVHFTNSAEENLAPEPVTKGAVIQSLADVGYALGAAPREPLAIPGYDPQAGARPPAGRADVVLVGVGAAGSLAAKVLAQAGLRVVGLEAGPYRGSGDFVPDELGSAYYCRGGMGPKFLSGRAHPRGQLLPRPHDEQRRRLGDPLGRGPAPLPPPPLPLPQLCPRALGRGRAAGGEHPGRLARRLR